MGITPTSRAAVAAAGVSVMVVVGLAVPTLPVSAATEQAGVVQENPADFTPNVMPSGKVSAPTVLSMAQRKGVMYAGGRFRVVDEAVRTRSVKRSNIVAFNATNGHIKRFSPRVKGDVTAIQPYKNAVFIGGDFRQVEGKNRIAIAKVNGKTGKLIKAFKSPFPWGDVTELSLAKGKLVVGGSFPGALRALNPKTGKVTKYMRLQIKGSVGAANAGPTRVIRFAVNRDRTRLVAVGNFTSVAGKDRSRAMMLNLGKRKAGLNKWHYKPFERRCASKKIPTYLRDVDFAPDGSYFVVVASGFVAPPKRIGTAVCDAAARFETRIKRPDAPTWINYTGGDSLYSTAVTGAAVYVQGHQRWLDNTYGRNSADANAVERKGIGAIDPDTGLALPWNPTKTRGVGGKELLATSAGLWVGSDTAQFAGEFHSRIAFCPL